MVFSSSVPVYLDPPNWHQHPNQQQVVPSDESSQQLPPLPPPHLVGGATASSIRPGSMADRARLAKIPQPEAALKCPRCESTNTKFCYFNNYSLTQPRHFCKTCRRYWTRGGALRSVPVGGGCRRNKKSKSQTGSKSSSGSSEKQMSSTSNSSSTSAAIPQLPFMGSLNNFTQFGVGNLGLNFGGINQGPVGSITSGANGQTDMGIFHMGINSGMQQFPFFEASQNNGLYPNFQSAETPSTIVGDGQLGSMASSSSRVSQLGTVKTEENHGLNLSRSFLGISESNHQFWAGGNSWTDLSGLNSSSTSHHLL